MTLPTLTLLALSGLLLTTTVGCGSEQQHAASVPEQADQLWTCGMHPQVVQDHPGSCPLCGMDLTPMKGKGGGGGSAPPDGERVISHWVAPMDPTYISDKPGKSPMGMDLVPVYEDEVGMGGGGLVTIDPVVVQNMGVRTQVVRPQTIFRHLRTIGEVQVAEDEVSVVNLRFDGWVERIFVDKTGDEVRAGQRLFEIYSPELVSAQDEYLLALRSQGADSALARSARRKLELWDIGARDIDAVAGSGEAARTIAIRAPSAGFVLHKNVVEGARVKAGQDLYRIGDLASIWVEAEVYEFDAPWVALGQPAQMELSFQKGTIIEGEVAYIYPTLNPKSRTLRVRLEFDNPGVALKPGMFATVRIQYRRQEDTLAVPTEAVIHSGERELVFVAMGQGRFAAREITTGLVADHHLTEVLSGLDEGDVVVTSGQFLIDSESQLQEAVQKLLALRAGGGDDQASTQPTTVFSCPMHPEIVQAEPGRCPDCGMFLEERAGTTDELAAVYGSDAAAHDGHAAGHHAGHDHGVSGGQAEPAYTCPMHPEILQDRPGKCPECGMFLESTQGGPYTCPMHPEILQDRPGKCPECGMFLERKDDDRHEHGN